MKELVLEAEPRKGSGKSVTRKMRSAGQLPAILYGLEKEPQMLGVNDRQLNRLLYSAQGENVLVDLVIGTHRPEKVLIKDVQHHPVTSRILHVDFLRIDLTKTITVNVPVHVIGTAEGVRSGGILETVTRELEVSCLPMDIPRHIEIDVTNLKINDSVHVSDLKVEKVQILDDPDRTVVIVAPPTVVKEAAPAAEGAEAAAEGAEPTEPEVITEKKKKDEDE